jgi:hypothetical protein
VTRRAGLSVAVLFAVVAVAACAKGPGYVARFDDARVELHVRYEPATDSTGVLVADFIPTESGIHLYGIDLPKAGIDGAGRPTRVTVSDSAWRSTTGSSASVSVTSVTFAGFTEPFPIYPDGPVTLRLGVERTATSDDGSIDATVTFMACTSTGLCYVPVEDHAIAVSTR